MGIFTGLLDDKSNKLTHLAVVLTKLRGDVNDCAHQRKKKELTSPAGYRFGPLSPCDDP